MEIDFNKADSLIYQNEILKVTVLGGIKLEGLDRMRVTLKVELQNSAIPPVRHNLDLYNDTQLEKFIRKAAEKLEIGTSIIAATLSELTTQLEQYRLEKLKETTLDVYTPKPLSPQEQKEAEAFLKNANLLENTNNLIGKSGVIGEELNRLLMFLIFTSRKTQTPLHIISLGASGVGKTHLQEKVGELVPEEDKIEITTLSENAFYYFGQRELKHKLILIEDLDGADSVLYPLRELQSKKRINKTVAHKSKNGDMRTVRLTVEGPVSVGGCTTKERIYEDNANRSFLIYLDETPQQDKKIMDYQRRAAAGKIDKMAEQGACDLLKNCQKLLEPVKVINPYAEHLELPPEVFKPRRTNSHYLQFIEAVTFYHQLQREHKVVEETGEVFIETTLDDIKEANKLLSETLLRKSDRLTGACRNYFERLKQWLGEEAKTAFTNSQARMALRENHSNQKRYMLQLQNCGLIEKDKGDKKNGYYYRVVTLEDYRNLKTGVTGVLDEVFGKLPKVVQSSKEVQKASEPLKASSRKAKSKKFTKTEKA